MLCVPTAVYAQVAENIAAAPAEIVVTAQKMDTYLDDVQIATSIKKISAEDTQLTDALVRMGSVDLAQSGGRGHVASLFMRGSKSNHYLMAVNGIPINDPASGMSPFYVLDAQDFTRIESVRGNVSSLYGSNAMGGAINLLQKPSIAVGQRMASINLGQSSKGSSTLSAKVTGNEGSPAQGVRYSVHAGASNEKNDSSIDPNILPVNSDKDNFQRRNISAHVDYRYGNQEFGINTLIQKANIAYDDPYQSIKNTQDSQDKLSLWHLYHIWNIQANMQLQTNIAHYQHNTKEYINRQEKTYLDQKSTYADMQLNWELIKGHTLSAQIENQQQEVFATKNYKKDNQNNTGLRLGYLGQIGVNHFQINIRRDITENKAAANTYYAGYGLDIHPNWRVGVSAANAFRLPAFNESYWPAWYSNQNLSAEKSKTVEAYVLYHNDQLRWRNTFFKQKYHDLIDYSFMDNKYMNIAKSKVQGVESLLEYQHNNINVYAALQYQDPVSYDDNNKPVLLPRRARAQANIGVNYKIRPSFLAYTPIDMGIHQKLIGSRQDIFFGPYSAENIRLPGYGSTDISMRVELNKNMDVLMRLNNIGNRKVYDVYGYQKTGREFLVNLGLNFK